MKETRKNRRWGTALRRAAAFFLCAACLLGGTGTSHAEEKPLRILLIGVDAYEDQARGRSDTMVLVQADPAAGEIRALSFLRGLVRAHSRLRNHPAERGLFLRRGIAAKDRTEK